MAEVYGLVDPRDEKVYYIGVTLGKPEVRLRDHMRDIKWSRFPNINKNKWLMELKSHGLRPRCTVLEVVEDSERFFVERRWIRKGFELNWPLTNNKSTAHCEVDDEQLRKILIEAALRDAKLSKDVQNKEAVPNIERLRLVTDLLYS